MTPSDGLYRWTDEMSQDRLAISTDDPIGREMARLAGAIEALEAERDRAWDLVVRERDRGKNNGPGWIPFTPSTMPGAEVSSYRLVFRKQIHSHMSSSSSSDRYVRREFSLPFVPFDGLTVRYGDFEETVLVRSDDNSSVELTYNIDTQTFTAWSDDKTIYRQVMNRQPQTPIDEIIAAYIGVGWELEPVA